MRRQPSKRKFAKKLKPKLSVAYISKWGRVISNLIAGSGIFATGVIVLLLLTQGMFHSTYFYKFTQDTWVPRYQSCRLSASGFSSCHPADVATTGAASWTSMGLQLASELDLHNSTVFATTCALNLPVSATQAIGKIFFLVGETSFPSCNPVGPQVILGMAVVDTVGTADFPDGAFLMSVFSDAKPIQPATVVDTQGNTIPVTTSATKTIVAVNGTRVPTTWGQRNFVTSLNCLNRFFLMQVWGVNHFPDLSASLKTMEGYSVGKTTGYITTFGLDNSHKVDNYMLLFLFQIVICCVTLVLLGNDGLITLEGLSGLLKNKPVLTYDILASLERRKILLFALIGVFLFSPLYADAIRYTYTINGYHYWSLSLVMVGLMMALSWMAILTCIVQWLPVPAAWRNRPVCYSAPFFVYCNCIGFVVVEAAQRRGPSAAATFWGDAPSTLCLNMDGMAVVSGAFSMDGATPIIYTLMPDIAVVLMVSWLVSIAAHKVLTGSVVLEMTWTAQNAFVNQVALPQWVTSLDLDKKNTIAIGTKLYCRPSLMVLLGYCTVHDDNKYRLPNDEHLNFSSHMSSHTEATEAGTSSVGTSTMRGKVMVQPQPGRPSKAPSSHEDVHYMVISIYGLLAATFPWIRKVYQPQIFGEIHQNKFTPSKSITRIEKAHAYVYSRGDCCS
ncbi:hypothetical protein AeMF1_003773 [Aphanomyces euteiches]|nr:hypothetical protein AeMF1_003773 [Aphanomyces euteiches]KAH9193454.1 hypothetical protein AeNC1_004576 [Aphanomyces euteiches]